MSGVMTTGSFAKLLWPGINSIYGAAYAEYPQEFMDIYDKQTSRKAFEEDVQMTDFGMAQIKKEGDAISYASSEQGYIHRYTHVTYALGFIITREMMEDDQYDMMANRRAKGLAFSKRQTKETVAANFLNRAFNSTYAGPDGVELCSTAHVHYTGGTWANELAVAADLSEASLEQACIDISKFTTDAGSKIAIQPQTLIIPADLEFEAARILKSIQQNDTANNAINAIRVLGKFPKGVKVNHYMTDADAWFIKTNCPDGLKYFERRADDFATDNDFDTENAKYKATGRYSFGCTDRRAIYGSPGA
jgi:phage major head subunit gpT-like protein